MDLEDTEHDVAKAKDVIKMLKRHSCGTVIVTLEQQVAMLDRRLRRVTRRHTRLVKSKHRDPKLEKYECCVDEIMDWLDQSELAVKDEVDVERLQEQVCTCEVRYPLLSMMCTLIMFMFTFTNMCDQFPNIIEINAKNCFLLCIVLFYSSFVSSFVVLFPMVSNLFEP